MKKAQSILKLITGAATVLAAVLLIWQCIDIYRTGTAPENQIAAGVFIRSVYSREIIAERFARIAWAIWTWAVLAIVALIVCSLGRTSARRALPARHTNEPAGKAGIHSGSIVIGVIAIALIAIGVLNGGMRDVFVKAINICTECIGLG